MPPERNHQLTRVGPVLIDTSDMAAMRDLAARHDRTLAGEMRRAIRVYVQQHRQAQTARTPPNTPAGRPAGRPAA